MITLQLDETQIKLTRGKFIVRQLPGNTYLRV